MAARMFRPTKAAMKVQKNFFIEGMVNFREDVLEKTGYYTARRVAVATVTLVGLPYIVYKLYNQGLADYDKHYLETAEKAGILGGSLKDDEGNVLPTHVYHGAKFAPIRLPLPSVFPGAPNTSNLPRPMEDAVLEYEAAQRADEEFTSRNGAIRYSTGDLFAKKAKPIEVDMPEVMYKEMLDLFEQHQTIQKMPHSDEKVKLAKELRERSRNVNAAINALVQRSKQIQLANSFVRPDTVNDPFVKANTQ